MRVIRNDKLIERNSKIGQWTPIAGMLTLAGGLYISMRQPERFGFAVAALLVGYALVLISTHYGRRFGRSPRPDERLDTGLKGLPGEFTLYHYVTPVPHLLVGPAGVWVLLPYQQRGRFSYDGRRWKLQGGGFMQWYLRVFGLEGIGSPERAATQEVRTATEYLVSKLDAGDVVTPQALLVFTAEDVMVEAGNTPVPALKLRQVKDFMRQGARERILPAQTAARVSAAIESSSA